MPSASVSSACLVGCALVPIQIEVDIHPGLPLLTIIGLPDRRIAEAAERVRAAIRNSDFKVPLGKITVNLSPSAVPKQGTGLDLAIALGILIASNQCRAVPSGCWVVGELALDGSVRAFDPLVMAMVEALEQGGIGLMLASACKEQAAAVPECPIVLVGTLGEAVASLKKGVSFTKGAFIPQPSTRRQEFLIDKVRGQAEAKRCLEIALAGNHHLLLTGPPGVGKSMLAKAAIQLLPRLSRQKALNLGRLLSLVGESYDLEKAEPSLRAPHHSCSRTVLIGGGGQGLPGEFALADSGILFLDEISEIGRPALESLRQPMQDGYIRLRRRGVEMVYYTSSLIIATRNPCACGLMGVEGQACRCSAGDIERYDRRLSEALLDRFDLFCGLPNQSDWTDEEGDGLLGKVMTRRIEQARRRQEKRYESDSCNGQANEEMVAQHVELSKEGNAYLKRAADAFYLSARGIQKILAVTRTIADLEGTEKPTLEHLQEAISYRHRRLVN